MATITKVVAHFFHQKPKLSFVWRLDSEQKKAEMFKDPQVSFKPQDINKRFPIVNDMKRAISYRKADDCMPYCLVHQH